MDIHPIRTETDYETALGEIARLWAAEQGTDAGDMLDVLIVLVKDYEKKHHAIDPPDPVEAIKFRMEQMNLSRKDPEKMIGSRARVSEVLNRRRSLSLNMIRSLHSDLNIPLESFISATQTISS